MKIFVVFLLSFILMMSSISAVAEETLVKRGYADEGFYYELYSQIINEDVSLCAEGTRYVTLEVIYDYMTFPPATLYWTEEVDGDVYAGNLELQQYSFDDNKTFATYGGILYRQ